MGAMMLLLAPAASAEPPGNDKFEDAQELTESLPIEVSATNVEATKEEGELHHGLLGSKGHSVWFEWTATDNGFVTVGTCGSDFTTVTSIYTGAKVDELNKVAGNFSDEGPGCPSLAGRQITFEATGGTTYEIAVDGDAFYLPPASPPLGEGAIELQIETTPIPANNGFADATVLTGSTFEEPGAEVAFYWATAPGFNWNATKELGEPSHAGDPGGASVWYSWTAPGSGPAAAGSCAGMPLAAGVYVGDSIGELTPVGTNEYPCAVEFTAVAGTTYRIAIDGEFDSETGGAARRSFTVNASMQLPPQPRSGDSSSSPPLASTTSPDTTPPDTAIRRSVLKRKPPIWGFHFSSNESGSTFECKLDKHLFAKCGSSRTFKHAKPGWHTLKVRAVDPSGNVDPSPAVAHFVVPVGGKPHRRH
jgi:hypothetical protein